MSSTRMRAACNWIAMISGVIWIWPYMLFNFVFADEAAEFRRGERSIFEE